MQCISCQNNEFEIYSEDSWLKIPVSRCKKCHLMITGNSLEELESTLKEYYIKNKTNEELDKTIKFDFDKSSYWRISQDKGLINLHACFSLNSWLRDR